MDNSIYEYIKNGITIDGNPDDGYTVFTIPTQHFKIDNLDELTAWTFENEIRKQKQHDELTSEIFKEVQKEIDQDIINQLRGGEPNPDIIPMGTIDRLFKNFLTNPDYNAECVADLMGSQAGQLVKCSNKFEFIDKLLFDDEFYQKWGEDCCEELTYIERYNIWIGNNYETGVEYIPEIVPDFDNDYYEPTPKRKLREMKNKLIGRTLDLDLGSTPVNVTIKEITDTKVIVDYNRSTPGRTEEFNTSDFEYFSGLKIK